MSQVQPTSQSELEKKAASEQVQAKAEDAKNANSDDLTDDQLDEISGGLRTVVAPRIEY